MKRTLGNADELVGLDFIVTMQISERASFLEIRILLFTVFCFASKKRPNTT